MGPNVPPPRTTFFVSPQGDDAAAGDEARPMRTVTRALSAPGATAVVLRPGRYVESPTIAHDVALTGEGGVVIEGTITIGAVVASFVRVDIDGGLVVGGAKNLSLSSLTVRSSSTSDAIALADSVASLTDVELFCGPETCLQVGTSTLAAVGLVLSPGRGEHKRGLRAETSSVTLRGVRAHGARIAQLQASARAHLTVLDATLPELVGNGIVANDSFLTGARIRIEGRGNTGIILSASDADLSGLEIGPLPNDAQGIGILGGKVRIADSHLVRAGVAAIVVNDHRERRADVVIERVVIEHGSATGIQHGQGALLLRAVRLIGNPSATSDGEDAILCSGETADLVVESAEIDAPAGFGIGVYRDAGARITGAVVTRPRLGGIIIDDSAGAALSIVSSRVSDCKQGSGIAVRNALEVTLEDVEVTRCPEAGLLVALGGDVVVGRSKFLMNRQYGVAAFGQSSLTVSGSTVRGSKWAAFASCADGSSVVDGGNNTFEGATTLCP